MISINIIIIIMIIAKHWEYLTGQVINKYAIVFMYLGECFFSPFLEHKNPINSNQWTNENCWYDSFRPQK